MNRIVGIDLGTTNSLVAYVENGVPRVIRDDSGDAIVPSIVHVADDGTISVGREAERRQATDPGRSVYSIKRFMGRGIDDVRDEIMWLPFRIGGEPGGVARILLGDRAYTPPELSALILRELKNRAEAFFRSQGDCDAVVDRAVITVPAYFNDAQRTATRDAGRIAGLDVLRIVNEPTAASLAYGLDKRNRGTIAIYDFGGGTFDISILRVEDGVFQVLATNGDTRLGGDDIDRQASSFLINFFEEHGACGPDVIHAVRTAVIRAKHELSTSEQAEIVIAGFGSRRGDGSVEEPGVRIVRDPAMTYCSAVDRAWFERNIRPIVDRTLEPCRQALADAGLKPSQIDEVVMVGGSTRIPLVRRLVGELFGRAPHTELDPDEVVALGAAVQANILDTGNREMLLLDVCPLSLGIETMGGVTSKIIVRNSTIPATGSEMFTTGVDNQTAVDVHVVQGERELVADNRSLARFRLRGIPPMPAGLPRVQVRFQIDANGILGVTASELRTGVEQAIEVKPSYGLTEEEVERMLLDSLDHAEDDLNAKRLVEAQNDARAVIAATEKSMRSPEYANLVSSELDPSEIARIENALTGLRAVVDSSDSDGIKTMTRALNEATNHLAHVIMTRSVQEALSGKNVDEF